MKSRSNRSFAAMGRAMGWVLFAGIALLVAWLLWTKGREKQQAVVPPPTQQTVPPPAPVPTPIPLPVPSPAPAPTPVPVPPESQAPRAGTIENLFLGNPSAAMTDLAHKDNYLMVKPYFALSYNNAKGIPNWVSWKVDKSDLGEAPRRQTFSTDETLPQGFARITHADYTGSGFDRGHMCPHSDRAADRVMSYATFEMTNIIPQAPNVNQEAWASLEMYSRSLVGSGKFTAFTICGPWGKGGVGSKGRAEAIGNGRVAVPAECWKVILVVPIEQSVDPEKVTAGARVIAVRMPNDNSKVGQAWEGYRVKPSEIERLTGYRFFTDLKPEVAAALREKKDAEAIGPAAPVNRTRN